MPKIKVSFKYGDGRKVTRGGAAAAFNLRSPIALTILPGSEVRVPLGLSCSHPVHIFQSKGLRERGVTLVDGVWACQDATENLVVYLKAAPGAEVRIDEGETIARCVVLDNTDVVVEE